MSRSDAICYPPPEHVKHEPREKGALRYAVVYVGAHCYMHLVTVANGETSKDRDICIQWLGALGYTQHIYSNICFSCESLNS